MHSQQRTPAQKAKGRLKNRTHLWQKGFQISSFTSTQVALQVKKIKGGAQRTLQNVRQELSTHFCSHWIQRLCHTRQSVSAQPPPAPGQVMYKELCGFGQKLLSWSGSLIKEAIEMGVENGAERDFCAFYFYNEYKKFLFSENSGLPEVLSVCLCPEVTSSLHLLLQNYPLFAQLWLPPSFPKNKTLSLFLSFFSQFPQPIEGKFR